MLRDPVNVENRSQQIIDAEIFDQLDKCEKRWSFLLMDSATDESATNSPIKMTYQESNKKTVYLSRTRKGD